MARGKRCSLVSTRRRSGNTNEVEEQWLKERHKRKTNFEVRQLKSAFCSHEISRQAMREPYAGLRSGTTVTHRMIVAVPLQTCGMGSPVKTCGCLKPGRVKRPFIKQNFKSVCCTAGTGRSSASLSTGFSR